MTEDCRRVEPLLSAWLDRALSRSEAVLVAQHLPVCPRCRREEATLRQTAALLSAAPPRALPEDLRAVLARSASAAMALPPRRNGRRVLRAGTAAVLAAITALGATAYAVGDDPAPKAPPVAVPLDTYVRDHLSRMTVLPAGPPALVEVRR